MRGHVVFGMMNQVSRLKFESYLQELFQAIVATNFLKLYQSGAQVMLITPAVQGTVCHSMSPSVSAGRLPCPKLKLGSG